MERTVIGAIVGDIVGSIYEWHNIRKKEFNLFDSKCFFTDDTIMTIATMYALMRGGETNHFIDEYKKYGRKYPTIPEDSYYEKTSPYGKLFRNWIFSNKCEPYNSYGNGSAMRVSPIAWWYEDIESVKKIAGISASVTHNHPEGIKGAECVAVAIFLARTGADKQQIEKYISQQYGYEIPRICDIMKINTPFSASCQDTVPMAIAAFLESTTFEDAIRSAIALGGDSDTIAAITGSIAEAYYDIPDYMVESTISFLDEHMRDVIKEFSKQLDARNK